MADGEVLGGEKAGAVGWAGGLRYGGSREGGGRFFP